VVACAVLVFAGNPTTLDYLAASLPLSMVAVAENLSFQTHFESIMRGVVEFKDVAYFVILIAAWIYACTLILEERKAN
ncbi:MAG: ABC transporter permease, partial [Planctomycetota bacterium]